MQSAKLKNLATFAYQKKPKLTRDAGIQLFLIEIPLHLSSILIWLMT